jgi:hypothetical protein
MKILVTGLALAVAASLSSADDLIIRSGPARTHLLELFTSEGCSSCPPAEVSFAEMTTHEKLWTKLVPIAWHVDYWDYLGWRDRFASAANSERERTYAAAWRSHSVYTPCFVLNGREWRSNSETPALQDTPGVLEAHLKDDDLEVTFAPQRNPEKAREVWVALLTGEESSRVTTGENAGRDLKHLFVVQTALHQPMQQAQGSWRAELHLPKHSDAKAIALWISSGIPEVEQAAGGWLKQK